MNIVEVLKKFVYDVWDFDKKIDATNPFSSVNYLIFLVIILLKGAL